MLREGQRHSPHQKNRVVCHGTPQKKGHKNAFIVISESESEGDTTPSVVNNNQKKKMKPRKRGRASSNKQRTNSRWDSKHNKTASAQTLGVHGHGKPHRNGNGTKNNDSNRPASSHPKLQKMMTEPVNIQFRGGAHALFSDSISERYTTDEETEYDRSRAKVNRSPPPSLSSLRAYTHTYALSLSLRALPQTTNPKKTTKQMHDVQRMAELPFENDKTFWPYYRLISDISHCNANQLLSACDRVFGMECLRDVLSKFVIQQMNSSLGLEDDGQLLDAV